MALVQVVTDSLGTLFPGLRAEFMPETVTHPRPIDRIFRQELAQYINKIFRKIDLVVRHIGFDDALKEMRGRRREEGQSVYYVFNVRPLKRIWQYGTLSLHSPATSKYEETDTSCPKIC